MKNNYIYNALLLTLSFALFSCAQGKLPITNNSAGTRSHLIPLEVSLSILDDYLNNDAAVETRGDGGYEKQKIASVDIICANELSTRSSSFPEENIEELVYLVNFEDNKGFAFLSADDRVPEVLIAITDSGHLAPERLAATYQQLFNESLSCKSGETFDPYDSTNDDWYVGNYVGEDGDEFFVSEYVGALTLGYVVGHVGGGHIIAPMLPSHGDEGSYEVIYSDGGETTVVSNMLNNYSSWRQGVSPYNTFIPNNYKVGCVNIATGKILAHFSGPGSISGAGWSVNWNAINTTPITSIGENSIGHLLAYLNSCCCSIEFGNSGTFTLPCLAAAFLRNFGYLNVSYQGYDTSTVRAALNDGCPVFVSAINMGNNLPEITKSHAWNIDGYKNKITYRTVNYYENGLLVSSNTYTETTTLVHCAFGWGGTCDGYFSSGIFQFYDTDGEYNNYCVYLRTITYDNPII